MEAKLVVVSGAARPSEFKLKLPTIIGRSKSVDLPVGHPLISRQHCELFAEGAVLKIRDLGSLNGTYVNEERIAEDTVLAPGATFTVGPLTFKAVYAAPSPSAVSAEPDGGELNFPEESGEAPFALGEDAVAPPDAADEPQKAPGRATVHVDKVGATVTENAPVTGAEPEDDNWLTGDGDSDSAAADSAAEDSAAQDGAAPIGEDDFLLAESPEDAFDTTFDSTIDIPQPAANPSAAADKTGKKAAGKAASSKAKKVEKAKPKGKASAEPKPAKTADAPAPAANGPEEEMDFAPPPARPHGKGHADDLDNLLDFLQ